MKFCVIIPVCNGSATIGRAVQSCLSQGVQLDRVIVVENGSSDATAEIVDAWDDPRVLVERLSIADRSAARNRGLDLAPAGGVVFLDADDELSPGALAAFERGFAQTEHADAIQGATQVHHVDGTMTRLPPEAGPAFHSRLHIRNSVPISSIALRRVPTNRFVVGQSYCEDWDFWLGELRWLEVSAIPDVVYERYVYPGQTSSDIVAMRAAELIVSGWHWNEPLRGIDRLRRYANCCLSLVIYQDGARRADVDAMVAAHPGLSFLGRFLRLPGVRRIVRASVRRRFGY